MFFSYLRNKGFSLVEVLIAMGVLSVVSVGVMQLTRNSTQTQKRTELNQNVMDVMNRININLLDSDSCQITLSDNGGTPVISDGRVVDNILSQFAPGTPIFAVGGAYFGNSTNIVNMTMQFTGPLTPDPNPSILRKYGQLALEITIDKSSPILGTAPFRVIKRTPSIAVTTNNLDEILSCHSMQDDAVSTARNLICQDLRGQINPISGACELRNYVDRNSTVILPDSDPLFMAVTWQFLDEFRIGILNPQYVDAAGDTMTGNLDMMSANINITSGNINISNGNQICIGGRCRNFNQTQCTDNGRIVQAINPNGTVTCGAPITCASNQYFEGLDPATGNPICKIVPFSTCGANQYVKQITANGAAICETIPANVMGQCPTGQVLIGYNALNVKVCRRPIINEMCPADQFVRGWDSSGTMQCEGPFKFLYGNRFYDFQCAPIGGTVETISGKKLCVFNASSCPGGWNREYVKTVPRYGEGSINCRCSRPSCTSPSNPNWHSTPQYCTHASQRHKHAAVCTGSCHNDGTSYVYATIFSVACY